MFGSRILLVEHEGEVAAGLEASLRKLGHDVSAVCATGEEAVDQVGKLMPDLVLLDVAIGGAMRASEAGDAIHTRYAIPVVYLTPASDPDVVSRTRVTESFSYLFAPFDEAELSSVISTSLCRHRMDRRLRDQKDWLAAILRFITDAVITTDRFRTVTSINPAAEALTGWSCEASEGRPLAEVFETVDRETGLSVDLNGSDPFDGPPREVLLRHRLGTLVPVTRNAAILKTDRGDVLGYVLTFQRSRTQA